MVSSLQGGAASIERASRVLASFLVGAPFCEEMNLAHLVPTLIPAVSPVIGAPASGESLWDHYRSNRIDVSGRSFPEWVERFDLDVMGDQRRELFVSDSGAFEKNGSASWAVYSWIGAEPCFAGDVLITEDVARFVPEEGALVSAIGPGPGNEKAAGTSSRRTPSAGWADPPPTKSSAASL